MSPFVDLSFEGPLRALDAEARRQAQRARPRDDRRARRRARARSRPRAKSASRSSVARARRSAPAATSRAWGGLPPLEMWRDWTRRGPSRLRGAGAPARAADRRADRPRLRRRPGARRGRRHSHRRDAASSSACRRPGSAWRRAGRARSGSCAASAPRPCAAWRWRARCSARKRRLPLGLVDEVVAPGEGAGARQARRGRYRQARTASRCRSSRR